VNELEVLELKRAMAGMAEVTRGFYLELRSQGFSEEEAMRLTSTWLRGTVIGASKNGGDDE
jgi:hypothetical protein